MQTRSRSVEDDINPDADQENDTSSDSELEPDTKQISRYLSHLVEHSNDLRLHLLGTLDDGDDNPPPAYFVPSAYWTTEEKNIFFHALSAQSRLRPDLISEEIGSKSLADVCAYIDKLEQGLQQSENDNVEFYPVSRNVFPTAHEVSEKWETFEDKLAEAVIDSEPTAQAEAYQAARDREVDQQRLVLRAPYRAKGERAKGRDREGEKLRKRMLKEFIQGRELQWKKEDLLNSLDVATMKAMDMLVRETEEARALDVETEQNPQQDSPSTTQAELEQAHAIVAGPSNGAVAQPMDFDEELIDPSLRSSSAPTRVQTPQFMHDSRPRTPEPSGSTLYDNFHPVTPPFPHLHPTASSSTLAPEQDAVSASGSPCAPPETEDPLSPGARRRLRKRMYMRRKRAEANGGEVDQTAVRLKPGRKKMKRPGETDDPDELTRHQHVSGKTLTYKMRERLDDAGITIEWIQDENLDVFHMAGLHKLMRMYNDLHDVPNSVVTEISIHIVRQLRNEVMRFLVRLVQRTIISREQDMRAKMHTKVWRLAENQVVTVADVAHALSLMGQEQANKKPLFENLLDKLGFAEEDFVDSDEETPSAPLSYAKGKQKASARRTDGADVEIEADANDTLRPSVNPILKSAPIHRVLFPPFVQLPAASPSSESPQSLLSYIPWATNSQTEAAGDVDTYSENEESDDDPLEQDLQEEDELDQRDSKYDAWREDQLWREFGLATGKRPVEYDGPRPRKKRKVVKTTEFVPSSDEEQE